MSNFDLETVKINPRIVIDAEYSFELMDFLTSNYIEWRYRQMALYAALYRTYVDCGRDKRLLEIIEKCAQKGEVCGKPGKILAVMGELVDGNDRLVNSRLFSLDSLKDWFFADNIRKGIYKYPPKSAYNPNENYYYFDFRQQYAHSTIDDLYGLISDLSRVYVVSSGNKRDAVIKLDSRIDTVRQTTEFNPLSEFKVNLAHFTGKVKVVASSDGKKTTYKTIKLNGDMQKWASLDFKTSEADEDEDGEIVEPEFVTIKTLSEANIKDTELFERLIRITGTTFVPYGIHLDSDPITDKHGQFNIFKGFRAKLVNVDEEGLVAFRKEPRSKLRLTKPLDISKIAPILYHIRGVLCGANITLKDCEDESEYKAKQATSEQLYVWLMNWMRWLLVRPQDKTGKVPVFAGDQGTGKNTLWDWFSRDVIGDGYCTQTNGADMITGNFNGVNFDKILVVLNELDTITDSKSAVFGKIKSLITEKKQRENKKNIESRDKIMFSNYVAISNNMYSVFIDKDDRRYVFFTIMLPKQWGELSIGDKSITAGNKNEYFTTLHNSLTPDTANIFATYLLSEFDGLMDIRQESHIPETDIKERLRTLSMNMYDRFKKQVSNFDTDSNFYSALQGECKEKAYVRELSRDVERWKVEPFDIVGDCQTEKDVYEAKFYLLGTKWCPEVYKKWAQEEHVKSSWSNFATHLGTFYRKIGTAKDKNLRRVLDVSNCLSEADKLEIYSLKNPNKPFTAAKPEQP